MTYLIARFSEGVFTVAMVEIGELHTEITSIGDTLGHLQQLVSLVLQALQEQQQRSQRPTDGGTGPEPEFESNSAQRFDRIEKALAALITAELARPKIGSKLEKTLVQAAKQLHAGGTSD